MRHRRKSEAQTEPTHAVDPATLTKVTRFDLAPGSAREAREFAREAVHEWHRDALADDAALVVDELVTASLAVGSPGTVLLHSTGHGIHIEITADEADFERGDFDAIALQIVEATAAAWGVSYTWPHFRAIWSDLEDVDLVATAAGTDDTVIDLRNR